MFRLKLTVISIPVIFPVPNTLNVTHLKYPYQPLGSCDRASWANVKENQQDATIRCLLSTSVSTCFGHHYAHLQENKDRVTAYGVLFWFCWMWLVAVVGRCVVGCEHCEGYCSVTFIEQYTICINTVFVLLKMGIMMPETRWDRSW